MLAAQGATVPQCRTVISGGRYFSLTHPANLPEFAPVISFNLETVSNLGIVQLGDVVSPATNRFSDVVITMCFEAGMAYRSA